MVTRAALLLVAGYGYLALLGAASMALLLPRRWLNFAVALAPHYGWAVLVAIGYPLNTVLPFRTVAVVLAAAALLILSFARLRQGSGMCAFMRRRPYAEAAWPALLGALTCAVAVTIHMHQGAMSAVVVDSDVEHFADVTASLLAFPIGWSVEAQQGLEATPVGLAYHYAHATLSAVSGIDTFSTAVPSHMLLLSLAMPGVFVFARSACGLRRSVSALATGLYALGGLPLVVAGFGWGQQTAAMAAVPFGLAALNLALRERDGRSLCSGGLAAALAAGSLYLATAPLVAASAVALGLAAAGRRWRGAETHLPASARFRRSLAPLRRLVWVGLIALAASAFSYLSAAAFLGARVHAGFLHIDELVGRSTHVSTFASLATALGVAPLDLVRDALTVQHQPLLAWPPAAGAPVVLPALIGGLLLTLAGLVWAAGSRPAVLCIAGAMGLYELYLRVLRPFPYGEFKLLSAAWFLVPCLAAGGLYWLARMGQPRRVFGRLSLPAAGLAALCYAAGLGLVQAHVVRFLSLPWGAALPERLMAEAQAIVRAVPPGASVLVSGQLTPSVAYTWSSQPTVNRAGFPSAAARVNYLSRRWRGIITSLLAFSGRPAYGLVQRYSTELRVPVPLGATAYVLLDAAEDPRLYGLLPSDVALSAGTLRLYRQTPRPVAAANELAHALSGDLFGDRPGCTRLGSTETTPGSCTKERAPALVLGVHATGKMITSRPDGNGHGAAAGAAWARSLPPPVLPVGESLPGRRNPAPPHLPASAGEPTPSAAGNLVIGLQALAPAHVEITVRGAAGEELRRQLALWPGLTWYTTAAMGWPVDASITLSPPTLEPLVRPVCVLAVPADPQPLEESLDRSDAGTVSPLLTLVARESPAAGSLVLDAWYTYVGTREGPSTTRLRDSDRLWIGGTATPTVLHLGPGSRWWHAELRPGDVPRQWSSDGRQLAKLPAAWLPQAGRRWFWLDIGPDREPSFHQPAVLEAQVMPGSAQLVRPLAPSFVLPLLADSAAPPNVTEATLVKGSGDDLFYVEHGRLRWVPTLDVLEQRRIPWRLSVLADASLWRLPVGLPLS